MQFRRAAVPNYLHAPLGHELGGVVCNCARSHSGALIAVRDRFRKDRTSDIAVNHDFAFCFWEARLSSVLTTNMTRRVMTEKPQNDPVLKRFRAAVNEIYGERVERVVLYGSRARGDHRPDSDYDIAVFIRDPGAFSADSAHLAEVSTDILLDTGAVISATPFPAGAYRERTGFMYALRNDGLDL